MSSIDIERGIPPIAMRPYDRPAPPRRRVLRLLALVLIAAVIAAACGDDAESVGSGPAGDEASDSSGVSQAGGSATVLVFNEVPGLDPVSMLPAAGSAGQRAFALYGALVVYDPADARIESLLAESLTSDTSGAEWTLVLRDGLEFSDGSAFDAAAVKRNWERAQDPSLRSPAYAVASSIAEMATVDDNTLRIRLRAPNAQFATAVARSSLNYIASAAAITAGTDLSTEPVGAGPFVLRNWVRDDRMVLARNDRWFDAPRPYLDELVFRIVPDEDQRMDTMLTGDAVAAYSGVSGSVRRALEEGAAGYASVTLSSGRALSFNTTKAPLDDVRVRRAIVLAVDTARLAEVTFGAGAIVADNFMHSESPWHTTEGALPEHDIGEAQRLIDEVVAETGEPVRMTIGTFQTSQDQSVAKFVQTALQQLEGVEVSIDVADSPTATGRVLSGDYQVHTWGYPILDPDPALYAAVRSGEATNYSRYESSTVDAALDAARVADSDDERRQLYSTVFAELAEDLPFFPVVHNTNGFVYTDAVTGVEVYEDGVLRVDLIALS